VASSVANSSIGTEKFGVLPAVRVRNSAAVSIHNNVVTRLSFDTEDYDTAGMHSSSGDTSSSLTAPVAGKYLIMASVRWSWNTNGRRLLILNLHTSTLTMQIGRNDVAPNPTGGFGPEQTVMTVFQLAAGDSVDVLAFQDSGVALDVAPWAPASPSFSMNWLGP
jgi:hypothetical protein